MTERIPGILAHLEHLKEGQIETREFIRNEITELKNDHIMDIRKNICRLWMAIQDLERIKERVTGAAGMVNILFIGLGGLMGAAISLLFKH